MLGGRVRVTTDEERIRISSSDDSSRPTGWRKNLHLTTLSQKVL